jgi:hypothetical protein
MDARLATDGPVSLVQLPHPGGEHTPGADGIRHWGYARKSNPHKRTFLKSSATYRAEIDGPDLAGEVVFWGEWEGETRAVGKLDSSSRRYPHWLCEPVISGALPTGEPNKSPQNTDPFVWGDAMVYTACRQDRNAKLRGLGRGSVILFGSRLRGEFVLDTVVVVAGYVDHNLSDRHFRDVLDGIASPANMRLTLEPWFHGGVETTFRYYVGATPENHVDGMFSFVPCLPLGDVDEGFPRPPIELDRYIKPGLAMQALTSDPLELSQVRALWRRVADQVANAELSIATRLELPVT